LALGVWLAIGGAISRPLGAQFAAPSIVPSPEPLPGSVWQISPAAGMWDACGPVWMLPENCPPQFLAPTHLGPPGGWGTVTAWRPFAPDCNLAVEIQEEFANRFIARTDRRPGAVRDFILGADVFGEQCTATSVRIDFQPCATAARAELVVDGEVDSQTVGVTRQAQIQTLGRHLFQLRKEIEFDGALVRTRSPAVSVTPRQRNVGAQTQVSGVPLLGPLANNIALQAADARSPAAAAITAEKITREAAPRFNDETDAQLAKLNSLLTEFVRPRLQQFDLLPSSQAVSTTDRSLLWCVSIAPPSETIRRRVDPTLGPGGQPSLGYLPLEGPGTSGSNPGWAPARAGSAGAMDSAGAMNSTGVAAGEMPAFPGDPESRLHGRAASVYLSESLVNGLLERLPLGGIGVPDTAIDHWFQGLASGAGLEELATAHPSLQPRLATIVFDSQRPIQLRFRDGRAELVLRLGLATVAGPTITPQEITIPFTVQLDAADVRFIPEEVTIVPADPNSPAGVIDEPARRVLKEQIQGRLQARSVPRRLPLPLTAERSTELQVGQITLHAGWLSVAFD